MIKIGNINELIVKRETDIAYTLYEENYPDIEYFLHFNQASRRLKVGEHIQVFMYYDNKRRLCGTMETPLVTSDKIGFGTVVTVDSNHQTGCFINIGTVKDILLSSDDLPKNLLGWPVVGDKLPILLKVKKNSIVAKIINKDDVKLYPNQDKKEYQIKDEVECTVTSFTTNGLTAWTDDLEYIFINKNLVRKKFHIGERISVHLIGKSEQGDFLGSQIEQKEKMRLNDAETIMNYLDNFGGVMKLGNNSTPEEISKLLNMSKSAFKRAIGNLYKLQKITIEDNRIVKK